MPIVVISGLSRNEAIASPVVTNCTEEDSLRVLRMAKNLAKFDTMTTIIK